LTNIKNKTPGIAGRFSLVQQRAGAKEI